MVLFAQYFHAQVGVEPIFNGDLTQNANKDHFQGILNTILEAPSLINFLSNI